VTREINSRNQR